MSRLQALTVAELARKAGAEVIGDPSRVVSGVATLEAAGPDQVAVFHHLGYRQAFVETKAGAVVLSPENADEAARGARPGWPAFLVSADPYLAFAKISALFHPEPAARPGTDPRAAVDPTAEIDPGAEVQPFAYVGPRARVGPGTVLHPFACVGADAAIGAGCVLHPGAVVAHGCVLGDRVTLQAGAVIGSDGFGYALDPQGPVHLKVPQVGRARVEDDVEIGANSCVDRATLGETVIGRGAKIDNLVQVAHNVTIGPLSILCAQVGIAGSSTIGARVVLAGQVGVAGHLNLGDGARVAAQGGVMNDVPAGETRSGAPAIPRRRWLRQMVAERQLPELLAEIQDLRARLTALEAKGSSSNGSGSMSDGSGSA